MARIQLFHGDITSLNIDAIVNAANESLLGGGGVDGAIHAAAGPALLAASRQLAPCPAGNAKLTPGFKLPAKWVIHAVGPIFQDGRQGEATILGQTYQSVLNIAAAQQFDTIAFPCISTGVYRFPPSSACQISVNTVLKWQSANKFPKSVIFCCFQASDVALYTDRLEELGLLHKFSD